MVLKNLMEDRSTQLMCCKCGIVGQENNVNFNLPFLSKDKILVKIFKPKFICTKCAKEEWLKKFEFLQIKDVVKIKRKRFNPKKIKRERIVCLNFEKYLEVIKKYPEKIQEINEILCDVGLLSFSQKKDKSISIKMGYNSYYISKKYIPKYLSMNSQES